MGSEMCIRDSLFPYQYPDKDTLEKAGVRIVYLGYYIKDFNNISNAEFAIKNGLKTRVDSAEETGCIHNFDALDDDFVHVNQLMKYLKFGFGKATDEVCELVRMGKMSRAEGIEVIKRVDGNCHQKFIDKYCRYLEIKDIDFKNIANSFRTEELWDFIDSEWVPKFKVGEIDD